MLDAPTTQPERLAAAADPGHHEAWSWLHATYRPPIGNLCLRSGLSPVEADDVIQDVLLRLSRRMAAKPINLRATSLRAWLAQVTHQRIFEVRRQRARFDLPPEALLLMAEWLPGTMAPHSDPGARHQLEQHLWAVCLDRVRAAVPPRSWQIFEAHGLHGLPSPEVARAFNTTQFNVRMIRTRMIRRIRRQWAVLAEEPIDLDDHPGAVSP